MKWPATITFVRHAESKYNVLGSEKKASSLYQEFKANYEQDCGRCAGAPFSPSPVTRRLADAVRERFHLGVGDHETPLTEEGVEQARQTGVTLKSIIPLPQAVYISPYHRTRDTRRWVGETWPEVLSVKTFWDDRLREQNHGLSLLYNDWRVFHVFHPEQKDLHDLMGPYWYTYPQGESVCDVRDRARSITTTLTREHACQDVLVFTHHLTILSFRANLERLSPEQFMHLDEHEKPVNCGITLYRGDASRGEDGRLGLEFYNKRHS